MRRDELLTWIPHIEADMDRRGLDTYVMVARNAVAQIKADGEEIDRLRAELAVCQQDAERYRWVLEHWDTGGPDFGKIMFSSTAETLSADIDTAHKGEGEVC